MPKRLFPLVCTCALSLASAQSAYAEPSELFSLIAERLEWMAPVAAWKYSEGAPVDDLAREQIVLEAAVTSAQKVGLAGDSVRGFFAVQIEAAKDIQRCWITRWSSGEIPPGDVPDLVEVVRPELLDLGERILLELSSEIADAGGIAPPAEEAFMDATQIECLGPDRRRALFEELTQVTAAAP